MRARAIITFACALPREAHLAKRHGTTILVGVNCRNGIPSREVVAYGYAGSLREDWPPGTLVDAHRVVNARGETIRNLTPLGIPGAKLGVVLGLDRIISEPEELRYMREVSGADIVDTETHLYTNLRGCVRAITDHPDRPLGEFAFVVEDNGRVSWRKVFAAFLNAPWNSTCVSINALKADRALRSLVWNT